MSTPAPIQKVVSTEGAKIYCEYRGRGPLLLLITGVMEDAGFYSAAADILAEKYTVVSYDRRCNSRSSGDRSTDMTVAQQARDAGVYHQSTGGRQGYCTWEERRCHYRPRTCCNQAGDN